MQLLFPRSCFNNPLPTIYQTITGISCVDTVCFLIFLLLHLFCTTPRSHPVSEIYTIKLLLLPLDLLTTHGYLLFLYSLIHNKKCRSFHANNLKLQGRHKLYHLHAPIHPQHHQPVFLKQCTPTGGAL